MSRNFSIAIISFLLSNTVLSQVCDEEYLKSQTLQSHERLPWWGAVATECRKSQRYYLIGGLLAKNAVRPNEAETYFRLGVEAGGEYSDPLKAELAQMYFEQGKTEPAEKLANILMKESPSYLGGYWQKTNILLSKGYTKEAIDLLNGTLSIEESAHTYSFLAIAYHMEMRHRESARAMQIALKLDRSELENVLAICSTAYSLTKLGYVKEADELLSKHLSIRPLSASNEEFRRASLFVQNYAIETKNPNK